MDFSAYLKKRGASLNTVKAYTTFIEKAELEGGPIARYERLVEEHAPKGTVEQARAAVGHWLRYQGKSDLEIKAALVPAKGRQPEESVSLSDSALDTYYAAANKRNGALRVILLLLPRTGLRVAEMCGLKRADVLDTPEGVALSFRGKGDKPRVVPMSPDAGNILLDWMDGLDDSTPYVFPGKQGRSLSVSAVQKTCQALSRAHPELKDLTPHVLRHTYATRAIALGLDIAHLKVLLGHSSISTTQRYLHPTVSTLFATVKKAGL